MRTPMDVERSLPTTCQWCNDKAIRWLEYGSRMSRSTSELAKSMSVHADMYRSLLVLRLVTFMRKVTLQCAGLGRDTVTRMEAARMRDNDHTTHNATQSIARATFT